MKRLVLTLVSILVAVCCCIVLTVATAAQAALSGWFGLVAGWLTGCTVDAGAVAADLAREHVTLTETQVGHAVTIYFTATEQGLSERAAVIATATAMQESSLRNLANSAHPSSLELPHDGVGSDHDSLGLFQQRPASGWGTVEELMDPATAAGKFYGALIAIEDWEAMALTDAAQRVQRSAYPNAYAKWEDEAARIVTGITARLDCDQAAASAISAEGWTHPLPGHPVTSGFRTTDRPSHDGVDLPARSGTPILAAGPGEVVKVRCNASLGGRSYSCNVDGSPEVAGCGWYVEIAHPDGTLTRYCHMRSEPPVAVGDKVVAGQVIGEVGSSGRSSGPHLHLECHYRSTDPGPDSAVAPTDFLAARGVRLEET